MYLPFLCDAVAAGLNKRKAFLNTGFKYYGEWAAEFPCLFPNIGKMLPPLTKQTLMMLHSQWRPDHVEIW